MVRKYFLMAFFLSFFALALKSATAIDPESFSGKVVVDGEIILGDRSSDKIKFFEMDGSASSPPQIDVPHNDYRNIDAIAAGDLDGDGIDEIVYARATEIGRSGDDKIHVYDVYPRYEELSKFDNDFDAIEGYDDLAVGDVNGDRKDEIILGDADDDYIRLFTINGNSDVNGDGNPDYFDVDFERHDRVAAGDVNGDGVEEIILGDASRNNITIYNINGNELASFEPNGGYSGEDEIASGDVDGDGIDEIVFGDGNGHKIYIYTMDGKVKNNLPPINAHFDSSDELAVGDVNRDGLDEIITGDENDGKIHIFDAAGRQLASFDVGYQNADGLAVGDINGDSIVIGNGRCEDKTISDVLIAVINAPPKHIGVNYDNDGFKVQFIMSETTEESHTRTLKHDVTFSQKASSAFPAGPFVTMKVKISNELAISLESSVGMKKTFSIVRSFDVTDRDRVVSMDIDYKVCTYDILKPEELAVIDGEQQTITIWMPVNYHPCTGCYYDEYENLPKTHTEGDIRTYFDSIDDLPGYDPSDTFQYSDGFPVAKGNYHADLKESFEKWDKEKLDIKHSISVTVGVEAGKEKEGLGASAESTLGYTFEYIDVAEFKLTKSDQIIIDYPGGLDDPEKFYDVQYILYRDSNNGYLVLDWVVPSHGSYYAKEYLESKIGTIQESLSSDGGVPTGGVLNKLGIEGDILDPGTFTTFENPYVYVESGEIANGTELELPIMISNAENIANMDVELRFNPSVLSVKGVVQGSLTENTLFDHNIQGDSIKLAFVSSDGINGDGSLALITFEVIGNPGDESTLILSVSGNDMDDRAVDFEIGNGILKVSSPQEAKGDCNGDGRIDSLDALIALEMAVGKRESSPIADMDDNGIVNSFDARKINEKGAFLASLSVKNALKGYTPGIKKHKIVDYTG